MAFTEETIEFLIVNRINDSKLWFQDHREDYLRLMTNTDELANDVGSVLNGEDAVRLGLIDRLGGLSDALGWLHGEIEKRSRMEP